jgi:hypothetical protein
VELLSNQALHLSCSLIWQLSSELADKSESRINKPLVIIHIPYGSAHNPQCNYTIPLVYLVVQLQWIYFSILLLTVCCAPDIFFEKSRHLCQGLATGWKIRVQFLTAIYLNTNTSKNVPWLISPPAQCVFRSLELKRQGDTVNPSTTTSQNFVSMPLYTSVVTFSVSRTLRQIRLVILTAVTIFWDVKVICLVYVYRRFRSTRCLHYQVVYESENASKTSVHLYQATRCHSQNYGSRQLPYLPFENICKLGQLKRYID